MYLFCSVHRSRFFTVRVSPFGNLRIEAYLQLPVAYRSLSRPSSASGAKAFALCSSLLELSLLWFSFFLLYSILLNCIWVSIINCFGFLHVWKGFSFFSCFFFHHLSDEIVVKPNFLFRKDQSLFVIPDFYKLIFSQLSVRFTHFAFIRFSMNAQPTVLR